MINCKKSVISWRSSTKEDQRFFYEKITLDMPASKSVQNILNLTKFKQEFFWRQLKGVFYVPEQEFIIYLKWTLLLLFNTSILSTYMISNQSSLNDWNMYSGPMFWMIFTKRGYKIVLKCSNQKIFSPRWKDSNLWLIHCIN